VAVGFNAINKADENNNVEWREKVVGVSCDGASVNSGNSVATRLKADNHNYCLIIVLHTVQSWPSQQQSKIRPALPSPKICCIKYTNIIKLQNSSSHGRSITKCTVTDLSHRRKFRSNALSLALPINQSNYITAIQMAG
jgi:hypothetical protein